MPVDLNLAGHTVVVTGASKGIGLSIARAFAQQGCHLHLVARSKIELERISTELSQAYSVNVSISAIDLQSSEAVAHIIDACPQTDILVNNAGDIPSGTLDEVDDARWKASWDVKIFSSISLTRAYFPGMKARRSGVVINIIGIAGDVLDPTYIAGSVGNAALTAFTKTVGGWSPQFGIRVVGVNPGPVQTERLERIQKNVAARKFGDQSRWSEITETLPFGRAAQSDEIAFAALYLASDQARYISGAVLTVDGGMSAGRKIM